MIDNDTHKRQSVDWKLIGVYLLLVVIGWLNIYAATHTSDPGSLLDFSGRAGKQFVWILTAFGLAGLILYVIPPRLWEGLCIPFYLFVLGLLVLVIFVSSDVKGSHSWFDLGPIRFQPAEVSKISTSLLLSWLVSQQNFKITRFKDFLLACLVLHLVHRHKVKKGHPPYSKWYVIAPYLTSIAAMTVLTAMLTYHLFAIDAVRIVCGSFTMLAIFLLSLRGTLRYKRKSSILLTTFLFVLFAVTFLFFDRTAKLPFSWVRMTAFALGVALLSVAAVRTFREPEPKEEGSAAD